MLCVGVKLDICPRSDDELVPGRASDGNIWVPTGIVAVGLDFIEVALIDSCIGLNAIRIPPTQVLFKARNRSFVPLEDTDDGSTRTSEKSDCCCRGEDGKAFNE